MLCLAAVLGSAQVNLKDSIANGWLFGVGIGNHWKTGELAKTYGSNLDVNLDIWYKTESNWMFGVGGNFLFGQDVKIAQDLFKGIQSSNLQIMDGNGSFADIRLFERGFAAQGKVGVLINQLGHNANSGLLLTAGMGWMQHRIRIESIGESTPQVQDEYAKGYDRLRMGYQFNQFIGYMSSSPRKTVNFMVGLDFRQGVTESMRGYQYDLKQTLTGTQVDYYWGLRFVWFLPVWDEGAQTYYYR